MVRSIARVLGAMFVGVALAATSGCMSFRPIEPVIAPPVQFTRDATVPVEFVSPAAIGMRCAERGAKFLALPGINSNACANVDLISMPNPCMTLTGGWYAATLCHQIARANGWSGENTLAEEAPAVGGVGADATLTSISMTSDGAVAPARKRPPAQYRGAATVPVEFLSVDRLAMRCAERGAKMMDLVGAPMGACADADLITMPNPCETVTAGWYASALCHEMAHANGWPETHVGGRYLHFAEGATPKSVALAQVVAADFAAMAVVSVGDANVGEFNLLLEDAPAPAVGVEPVGYTVATGVPAQSSHPVAVTEAAQAAGAGDEASLRPRQDAVEASSAVVEAPASALLQEKAVLAAAKRAGLASASRVDKAAVPTV